MPQVAHSLMSGVNMHALTRWDVADLAARNALTVVAADLHKLCHVAATGTYYVLAAVTPSVVWKQVSNDAFPNAVMDVAYDNVSETLTVTLLDGTTVALPLNQVYDGNAVEAVAFDAATGTMTFTFRDLTTQAIVVGGGGGAGLAVGDAILQNRYQLPMAGMLRLDGSTHTRTDYPALSAIFNPNFGPKFPLTAGAGEPLETQVPGLVGIVTTSAVNYWFVGLSNGDFYILNFTTAIPITSDTTTYEAIYRYIGKNSLNDYLYFTAKAAGVDIVMRIQGNETLTPLTDTLPITETVGPATVDTYDLSTLVVADIVTNELVFYDLPNATNRVVQLTLPATPRRVDVVDGKIFVALSAAPYLKVYDATTLADLTPAWVSTLTSPLLQEPLKGVAYVTSFPDGTLLYFNPLSSVMLVVIDVTTTGLPLHTDTDFQSVLTALDPVEHWSNSGLFALGSVLIFWAGPRVITYIIQPNSNITEPRFNTLGINATAKVDFLAKGLNNELIFNIIDENGANGLSTYNTTSSLQSDFTLPTVTAPDPLMEWRIKAVE